MLQNKIFTLNSQATSESVNGIYPIGFDSISFKWRVPSRIVSYIEMMLGILGILAIVLGVPIVIFLYSIGITDFLDEQMKKDLENPWIFIILSCLFGITIFTVQIWCANILKNATAAETGCRTNDDHFEKNCEFWKKFSLFLLVLFALEIFESYDSAIFWIWISFRAICILIVECHIQELKAESQRTQLNLKLAHLLNSKKLE